MPALRDLQATLAALIMAPEGVDKALADRGFDAAHVEALVGGDQRLSAVGRLDIYANMYFYRILDVLRGDYPKLLTILGDTAFHNLATDYLLACPSRHPSLRNVGASLPSFLAGRTPAWLSDLARLERARLEVFDGPDAPVLELATLRALLLAPNAFVCLRLLRIPASVLLRVEYAVDDRWAAEDDPAMVEPNREPSNLLIWRQGTDVYHRVLDDREAGLLESLETNTTFGVICDQICNTTPDDPVRTAFELLHRWVSDGLLATVEGVT